MNPFKLGIVIFWVNLLICGDHGIKIGLPALGGWRCESTGLDEGAPKISRILFVNPTSLGVEWNLPNNGKCMKMEYSLVQIPEAIHGMTREKLSSSFLEAQMEAKRQFWKNILYVWWKCVCFASLCFPRKGDGPVYFASREFMVYTNKGWWYSHWTWEYILWTQYLQRSRKNLNPICYPGSLLVKTPICVAAQDHIPTLPTAFTIHSPIVHTFYTYEWAVPFDAPSLKVALFAGDFTHHMCIIYIWYIYIYVCIAIIVVCIFICLSYSYHILQLWISLVHIYIYTYTFFIFHNNYIW